MSRVLHRFFLLHATCSSLTSSVVVDCYAVIPDSMDSDDTLLLPELPPPWQYLPAEDTCDPLSAVSDLLQTPQIKKKAYRFAILIDSTAKGPFMPLYMQQHTTWLDVFILGLQQRNISILSSTIRCAPSSQHRRSIYTNDPYALALDSVGIAALHAAVAELPCSQRRSDYFATAVAMNGVLSMMGQQFSSLQYKYRNVDWLAELARTCAETPLSAWQAYNSDSDPLEVMFVKSTEKQHAMGWEVVHHATTLAHWMNSLGTADRDIHSNNYITHEDAIDSGLRCWFYNLGPQECFDSVLYLERNPDLLEPLHGCVPYDNATQCFKHFIVSGGVEGRYASFKCPLHVPESLEAYVTAPAAFSPI